MVESNSNILAKNIWICVSWVNLFKVNQISEENSIYLISSPCVWQKLDIQNKWNVRQGKERSC